VQQPRVTHDQFVAGIRVNLAGVVSKVNMVKKVNDGTGNYAARWPKPLSEPRWTRTSGQ